MNPVEKLSSYFKKSFEEERFIKLILSKPKNKSVDYQKIKFETVALKDGLKIKCVYTTQTQEMTHNYSLDEALEVIDRYTENQLKNGILFCTDEDLHWFTNKKMKSTVKHLKPTLEKPQDLHHDKFKKRWVSEGKSGYLVDLEVCNAQGEIAPKMSRKFKQIDKYIDTLNGIIKHSALLEKSHLKIVDMGSGKGYLTFALHEYITHHLQKTCEIVGVEQRPDLVALCNEIAQKHDMQGLSFKQGSIADYGIEPIDVLIALHACDTATDDAIYKGIKSNAELIVTAPCCHKQVRKSLNVANELSNITQFGILQERQAEILTDSIRALSLESEGYKSQVFEFIADAHTHKNVMVVGVKKQRLETPQKYLDKIDALKNMFGVEYQKLERKLRKQ